MFHRHAGGPALERGQVERRARTVTGQPASAPGHSLRPATGAATLLPGAQCLAGPAQRRPDFSDSLLDGFEHGILGSPDFHRDFSRRNSGAVWGLVRVVLDRHRDGPARQTATSGRAGHIGPRAVAELARRVSAGLRRAVWRANFADRLGEFDHDVVPLRLRNRPGLWSSRAVEVAAGLP